MNHFETKVPKIHQKTSPYKLEKWKEKKYPLLNNTSCKIKSLSKMSYLYAQYE